MWRVLREVLKNRLSLVGVIIIVIFVVMAVFAPVLVGPYQNQLALSTPNQAPSWQHLMGTDETGQDVLNLLVYGSQISLIVGFVASLLAIILGTGIGLVAGYYGK